MKGQRFISIILSLLMFLSCFVGVDLSAYAAISSSGKCGDNVSYTFNNSTGEVVISGTGDMEDHYGSGSPFYDQKGVKSVRINPGVTSVGASAFDGCTDLTSVTIPDTVTSIGSYAFYGCSNLSSITIPDSVTSIGSYAFAYCTELTSVTIPNSVNSIGERAFTGCSGLTIVRIPDEIKFVGEDAFYDVKNVEYHGKLSGAPWGADCLNAYVEGDLIFKDSSKQDLIACSSAATDVVIPDSVVRVNWYAFNYIYLDSLTIGSGIIAIPARSLQHACFKKIIIPASVIAIGDFAFTGNVFIEQIVVDDDNPNYSSKDGVLFNKNKTALLFYPHDKSGEKYVVPSTVKLIYDSAFDGLFRLKLLVLNENVEQIQHHAIYNCFNLISVYIRNSNCKFTGSAISYGDKNPYYNYNTNYDSWSFKDWDDEDEDWDDEDEDWDDEDEDWDDEDEDRDHEDEDRDHEDDVTLSIYAYYAHNDLALVSSENSTTQKYVEWYNKEYYNDIKFVSSSKEDCSSGKHFGIDEYCVFCGAALCDHEYNVTTVAPTCTEKGYSKHTCSKCQDSYNDTYVDIIPHTWNSGVVTKESTEDEFGIKTYTCTVCKTIKTETIPKKAHVHINASAVKENEVEATCIKDGSYDSVVYCSKCGDEVSRTKKTVAKLGHSYSSKVTAPTCITAGYTTYTCSRCNDTYKGDNKSALGHSFTNYVSNNDGVDATCTTAGKTDSKTAKCDRCDQTDTIASTTISATGHKWNSGVVTKEATEEETGIKIYTCTVCKEAREEVIPTKNHIHTNATAVTENRVEATCTKDGSYDSVVYCSKCNQEVSRTKKTVAKLGHSFTNYASNNDGVAATCTTAGKTDSKTAKCDRCSQTNTIAGTIISATGHKWDSGVVTKEATGSETGIKTYTCNLCLQTKTEVIPKIGITGECGDNLTWVLDKSGTLTISGKGDMTDYYFEEPSWKDYKSKIKCIIIENGVTSIGANAFEDCQNLLEVKIPSSVKTIGDKAFYFCENLENLIIPNGVTRIGHSAFLWCSNLNSVVIPDSVNYIDDNAFADCEGLTNVTIGSGVLSVGDSAFMSCNNLKSVVIKYGVQEISDCAFLNCHKLTNIEIPDSVSYIGSEAFNGCENLKYVYYGGNENDWSNVNIRSENDCLLNANVYCNGVLHKHAYKNQYVKKATTTANGKLDRNCIKCGACSTVTISKISSVGISSTKYNYDGKVKTPVVTVKDSKGKTLVKDKDYTVTYSKGRKNVGKYNVKITFKGNYSGTVTKTFTIIPKGTTISKLTATKNGFKSTWKKQATQTTGYQIRYSTKSNMSGAKTVTVTKNGTVSKNISKLTAKKKYYVQIRTYKTVSGTKYYSTWSKAKTVTTK